MESDAPYELAALMNIGNAQSSGMADSLAACPLLTALIERRSRRFGLGMEIPAGPLAYKRRHKARPLTDEQEAAVGFAACGSRGPGRAGRACGEGVSRDR